MQRGNAKKEAELANKELKEAAKLLCKSTENYLNAMLDLAKLHGSKKVRQVKPHILEIAKAADKIHHRFVRK